MRTIPGCVSSTSTALPSIDAASRTDAGVRPSSSLDAPAAAAARSPTTSRQQLLRSHVMALWRDT